MTQCCQDRRQARLCRQRQIAGAPQAASESGRAAAGITKTEKHATGESVHADDMAMRTLAKAGGNLRNRQVDAGPASAVGMNAHEESPVRILLIEDDPETAEYVVAGLQSEAHDLEVASDGRTGLLRAASETWDLLIVDRMLPGLDGLAVVRTLRASGIATPVLFLTTMGGIDDRVTGLNAGGDDYLVKPFAFAELVARVAALGRRPQRTAPETVLRVADLEIDLLTRIVRRGGEEIDVAAAGIRAAGIPDEARRPGGDPDHAAGKRLGLSFRSPHQPGRKPYQPAARQDRPRPAGTDRHRARQRILPPCACLDRFAPPAFG